jgi:hypothetical protein
MSRYHRRVRGGRLTPGDHSEPDLYHSDNEGQAESYADFQNLIASIEGHYSKFLKIITFDPKIRLFLRYGPPEGNHTAFYKPKYNQVYINNKLLMPKLQNQQVVLDNEEWLMTIKTLSLHEGCHKLFTRMGDLLTIDPASKKAEKFEKSIPQLRDELSNCMKEFNTMEDQRIENLFHTLYPASRKYLIHNITKLILEQAAKKEPSIRAEYYAQSYMLLYGRRFILPDYLLDDIRKISVAKYGEEIIRKYENIMDRFLVVKNNDYIGQLNLSKELHDLFYNNDMIMDLIPGGNELGVGSGSMVKKTPGAQKREKALQEKVEQQVEEDVKEQEKEREEAETETEPGTDEEQEESKPSDEGNEDGEGEGSGEDGESDENEDTDESGGEGEKSEEDNKDSKKQEGEGGEGGESEESDGDGEESDEDSTSDGGEGEEEYDDIEDVEEDLGTEGDFDTAPEAPQESNNCGQGGEIKSEPKAEEQEKQPETEEEMAVKITNELEGLEDKAEQVIIPDIKTDYDRIIKSNPFPYRLEVNDYTIASMIKKELTRLMSGLMENISYGNRSGRVHMPAARRLEFDPHGRKIFKKRLKEVVGDARMAISLVIDTSGSMGNIWSYHNKKAVVSRVAYLLTNEMEKLGHAGEVRLFADHVAYAKRFDQKGDWSSTKFDSAGGGTCACNLAMRESMKALTEIGNRDDIKTKVIMVLSDGEWSDGSVIKEVIEECKKNRILVVFIQYNNLTSGYGYNIYVRNNKETYKWDIYELIEPNKISTDLLPTMKRVIVNLEKRIVRNIRLWEGR